MPDKLVNVPPAHRGYDSSAEANCLVRLAIHHFKIIVVMQYTAQVISCSSQEEAGIRGNIDPNQGH